MMVRSKGLFRRSTVVMMALGLSFALGCQSSPETVEEPQATQAPEETEEAADTTEPGYQEESTYHEAGAEVPTSPAEVTEAQVDSFAHAYVEVMNIQIEMEPRIQATTDPEEMAYLQTKAEEQTLEAVENQDLTVEEFNAIAQMLAYDEALRDRIQARVDGIVN